MRQGCLLSPLIFNLLIAEHIHSNPAISGLQIVNSSHKISLFADNVILIFTNSPPSLAEVQNTLNWFSRVSYYKVNTTKSFILDIKLDATTKNLLQLQHSFTWPDKDISYLGVQLIRSFRNLYSYNFLLLLQKIQTDSLQIAKHELSWSGRLAAFKMTCLPQILYYFRTLPIPSSFFRSLQTIFNKFFWKSKRSRCAHLKLIKHKLAGGTGSIDFEDYYIAAILTQLPTLPNSLWGKIENISLIRPNLKNWLMSTPLGFVIPTTISPTMKASVQAWKKLTTFSDYTPHHPTEPHTLRVSTLLITGSKLITLDTSGDPFTTESATRQ